MISLDASMLFSADAYSFTIDCPTYRRVSFDIFKAMIEPQRFKQ